MIDFSEINRQSTSGKLSQSKGPGLGLVICKNATEAQGGVSVRGFTGSRIVF